MLLRFQAGKVLMLLAITSWVAFTLPIGYIHPPVVRCFSMPPVVNFLFTINLPLSCSCKAWNGSRYLLQEPKYTREQESFERRKR